MYEQQTAPVKTFRFAAEDLLHGDTVTVETSNVSLGELVNGPIVTLLIGIGFTREGVMEAMMEVAEEEMRVLAQDDPAVES